MGMGNPGIQGRRRIAWAHETVLSKPAIPSSSERYFNTSVFALPAIPDSSGYFLFSFHYNWCHRSQASSSSMFGVTLDLATAHSS